MEGRLGQFQTAGSSALAVDYRQPPQAEIINLSSYRQIKKDALAFRPEFYEKASNQQVADDLTSYLGEYRFNVPEFNYKIGIINGRLVDPNTGDDMEEKAQRAIGEREKNGLSTAREIAEKEGLISIRNQLAQNPTGTIIWFSPPGAKEDGYGEYGFGFVGRKTGDTLEMTAIRVESPQINDFNIASEALWREKYKKAEDFLSSPKVIDQDIDLVKEFIHGNFEIRDQKTKQVFARSLNRLRGAIDETTRIIRTGTKKEIKKALNTLENLAIEIKGRYDSSLDGQVVFISDFHVPDFAIAMSLQKYQVDPAPVLGSCGMSGKIETSNVFGKLLTPLKDGMYDKADQEWFSCPRCHYKADGPVGDKCPGCKLTKEEFAQSGEEVC